MEQERREEAARELDRKLKAKRTRKIVIAAVLIIAAAVFAVGLLPRMSGGQTVGTVTVEINCSELSEDMDRLQDEGVREYIPKDGVILPETEYEFHEGDTVYDALKEVCRNRDIAFVKDGSGKRVYISSIGHLEEFDAGKNSGWMYKVNGESPNVGCGQYKLHDKDIVVWYYTVDYTK